MIFSESEILKGKGLKDQIGYLRSVLKRPSSYNIFWAIYLNARNEKLNIVNNIMFGMAEL